MDSGSAKKRMKVVFSGRIQGVGFRYTVCRVAETFTVAGYVAKEQVHWMPATGQYENFGILF